MRRFLLVLSTVILVLGGSSAVLAASPVDSIEMIKEREWPNLGADYKLIGLPTKDYNCIAWAMGETHRWVWPGEQVEDFDRLFGGEGFRRISTMDYRQRAGFDKIVLYAIRNGGRWMCTHACRQMADGSWTNKLGAMPLIDVPHPDRLSGPTYGMPVAVYVRGKAAEPGNGIKYFRIVNVLTGKSLDLMPSLDAAQEVVQNRYNGIESQQWKLVKQGDSWMLVNRATGGCLDVPMASNKLGTKMICYPIHGKVNQLWKFDKVGDYWRVTSVANRLVLDVSWGDVADGTPLLVWGYHGDKNQLWEFRPVD